MAATIGGCALLVLLSGCVTPAPDDATYEKKAALSAASAISDVETAKLAVQTWLDHRIAGTYLEVVVVDAESSIGGVSDTFASIEAPETDRSDRLNKRTTDALSAAEDALTRLRIAVREDDRAAIERSQQALDASVSDLEPIAALS